MYCSSLGTRLMLLLVIFVILDGGNGLTRAVGDVELSTLTMPTGLRLVGSAVGDLNGWSVSDAGDVNGDKIGDIIIGSPLEDPQPGRNDAGAAYVIFGHNTTIPANAGLLASMDLSQFAGGASLGYRFVGPGANSGAVISVSGAGDFNGDGLADIIIGANAADPTGSRTNAGAAYVIMGSVAWLGNLDLAALSSQPTRGFAILGAFSLDNLGISVSSADINDDGKSDVVVGAYSANVDIFRAQAGKAYVVFGRAGPTFADVDTFSEPTSPLTMFRILGPQANNQLGWSVHSAGDCNGDGVDDLMIAANLGIHGARTGAGTVGKINMVGGLPPISSLKFFIHHIFFS